MLKITKKNDKINYTVENFYFFSFPNDAELLQTEFIE